MKILYAIFYTENFERITKFYKEIVGLEVESLQGDSFVSFKLENGLLGIKTKVEEREIPGHQSLIVSVSNVEELYEQYKQRDVVWYKELTKQDWGTNFAILDPDGNQLEFVQEA